MTPIRDFTNPITGSTFRLRTDGSDGRWRITKAIPAADGAVTVRHLRLTSALGTPPDTADIDRLVRGEHQVTTGTPPAMDHAIAFAEAVLLDLHRTSTVLTAMAAEARDRCAAGARGFRPGCAHLRRMEREAFVQAAAGCRDLAEAWRSSGLDGTPGLVGLPEWLTAALEDQHETGPPDAEIRPASRTS